MNATGPAGLVDQLGAHSFVWAPSWVGDDGVTVAAGVAAAGLSTVEIPLLDPSAIDPASVARLLDEHGLTPTCSLGLPASARAAEHPAAALAFLEHAIDVAAALGSRWLTGALYGQLGHVTGRPPTDLELTTVAGVLSAAADHAVRRDVRLGIELINRYETYLVNTAEQVMALLDRIDRPGRVHAHLDTFHANIEEADIAQAVHLMGDRLGYVHLGESNRGVIGSGLFPFATLFDALHDTGFAGPMVIEAFVEAPPDLLARTGTWRPVAGTSEEFITASVDHVRRLVGQMSDRISGPGRRPPRREDGA